MLSLARVLGTLLTPGFCLSDSGLTSRSGSMLPVILAKSSITWEYSAWKERFICLVQYGVPKDLFLCVVWSESSSSSEPSSSGLLESEESRDTPCLDPGPDSLVDSASRLVYLGLACHSSVPHQILSCQDHLYCR